jgi:hypothetical protein
VKLIAAPFFPDERVGVLKLFRICFLPGIGRYIFNLEHFFYLVPS